MQALSQAECDVSNLSAACSLDQPTVSKHLAALRRAGLVQVRVDARRRCYSLTHEEVVKSLLNLLGELEGRPGAPVTVLAARPPGLLQ
ncbi:MAG: helix-turn-helix domain-containing protein [Actinobacteria bacterium]|nr:helix-turn-helix domain-containing protein [Actinomycetota bacterium]